LDEEACDLVRPFTLKEIEETLMDMDTTTALDQMVCCDAPGF
jgi:hypothetical protein